MGDDQDRTMYVGNLHDDVTDDLLYELFLQAGPLQSIKRVKDRDTGRLKNFAFVMFTHAASVPYAIHLTNGLKLLGRPLKTQQRNNVDLPHYLSVGVHSIESESELQQRLGGDVPSPEDYAKGNDGYRNTNEGCYQSNGRQGSGHFKPQPLDPNQVWKNNIDYHQQHETNRYMSNASMMVGSPQMKPDNNQRNSGRSPSNSPSGAIHARSASHYHQMSSSILDQMSSGSGDVRSRLGNASYRSTRDDRSGSHSSYNASRSYDGSHSYGGRDNSDRGFSRSGSNGSYSPYNANMRAHGSSSNSKYGSNRYYNSNVDERGYSRGNEYEGPERMQHRLSGSPQDNRHRSYSHGNGDEQYRHHR